MLHEMITTRREQILDRYRAAVVDVPRVSDPLHGASLFLDQLALALRHTSGTIHAIRENAAVHAAEMRAEGFTVVQVVRGYGAICQVLTKLAIETDTAIRNEEFQILNLTLDEATAAAVTEYTRLREYEGTERLGRLSHDLRDILHRTILAYDMVRDGSVALNGSTADLVTRSLRSLGKLIDRELTDVRLSVGMHHAATFTVRELVADVALVAELDARANGIQFFVASQAEDEVALHVDRQIIESVLGNLLTNAVKFSHKGGRVSLLSRASEGRVFFDVQDECGGLPIGQTQQLFRPFAQAGTNRRGVGLGLAICHDGALANGGTVSVRNLPGEGCVFTLELPRHVSAPTA
jgi:signal transduction histidine kinase